MSLMIQLLLLFFEELLLFDDDEVLMGLLDVHNHMKYLTIKRYSLILFSFIVIVYIA